MTDPGLSVVVASVNGLPYLADCLTALETRAPDAEIVVADWTDDATRETVRRRWPRVRLLSFDEPKTVPELRAAGIADTTSSYVAVIEDHCNVREGWADRIVELHRAGRPVVGGPVYNAATARSRDWAAFFCEYSASMAPAPVGEVETLVGMNVSYDRRALDAMRPLLEQGRWESDLHPHLQRSGLPLFADDAVALDHAKDFGFREFVSQRYHYSRSYAGMRLESLGAQRWVHLLGSPLLVPVLYARIAGNVFRRRVHRRELLKATPLIVLYLCVWSFGEAVGYAFGGGRSLLKVR